MDTVNRRNLTICVDMDDVVENFTPHWHAELDMMFGTSYAVYKPMRLDGPPVTTSLDVWLDEENYRTYFPRAASFEALLEPLRDPHFWSAVRAIPGAANVTKRLQGLGHDVYLASRAEYYSWEPKLSKCIFKFLPHIGEDHCICIPNKQLLNCDVLVDDSPDHLCGGRYIGLLWDLPRNRWFDCGEWSGLRTHNIIVRVHGWKEIELVVREIMAEPVCLNVCDADYSRIEFLRRLQKICGEH